MLTMGFGNVSSKQVTVNPLEVATQARVKVLEVMIKQGLGMRPIVVAVAVDEAALHGAFGQWHAVKENANRYAGLYNIVDVPFVGEL